MPIARNARISGGEPTGEVLTSDDCVDWETAVVVVIVAGWEAMSGGGGTGAWDCDDVKFLSVHQFARHLITQRFLLPFFPYLFISGLLTAQSADYTRYDSKYVRV